MPSYWHVCLLVFNQTAITPHGFNKGGTIPYKQEVALRQKLVVMDHVDG